MSLGKRETWPARLNRAIRQKGVGRIVTDRLRWYSRWMQMDNWLVGRLVELRGSRVTLDGLVFNVKNDLISTRQKSTIYFGLYEMGERDLVKRHIDPQLPTVELGGSIGVVACTTNRRLSKPSEHVVVEANPLLVPTLTLNRDSNDCKFAIEPAAIGYEGNTIEFNISDHFLMGRLGHGAKSVSVPTITLGKLIDKYGFSKINLIVDIEGAENDMIINEPEVFRTHVKHLVLETHSQFVGQDCVNSMIDRLKQIGFEISEQADEPVVALVNTAI